MPFIDAATIASANFIDRLIHEGVFTYACKAVDKAVIISISLLFTPCCDSFDVQIVQILIGKICNTQIKSVHVVSGDFSRQP